MPGAVVTATVSAVMPFTLFKKFTRQEQYKSLSNGYSNGEYQSSAMVGSTRRRWDLSKRLAASDLSTLEAFYVAQNGRQIPFYIYDIMTPGVVWDNTGVVTTGRASVCFDSSLTETIGVGRGDVPFSITEIS